MQKENDQLMQRDGNVMNEEQQKGNGELTVEERRKKVVGLCRCFADRLEKSADSWEKLNDMARNALAEAEKSIKKRQYKAFAMYLRTYSYLWNYAYENLNPKEYQYFCAGQSALVSNYVM